MFFFSPQFLDGPCCALTVAWISGVEFIAKSFEWVCVHMHVSVYLGKVAPLIKESNGKQDPLEREGTHSSTDGSHLDYLSQAYPRSSHLASISFSDTSWKFSTGLLLPPLWLEILTCRLQISLLVFWRWVSSTVCFKVWSLGHSQPSLWCLRSCSS